MPAATTSPSRSLVVQIVFRAATQRYRFLLLLAIADDALGFLIVLAIFYPAGRCP